MIVTSSDDNTIEMRFRFSRTFVHNSVAPRILMCFSANFCNCLHILSLCNFAIATRVIVLIKIAPYDNKSVLRFVSYM